MHASRQENHAWQLLFMRQHERRWPGVWRGRQAQALAVWSLLPACPCPPWHGAAGSSSCGMTWQQQLLKAGEKQNDWLLPGKGIQGAFPSILCQNSLVQQWQAASAPLQAKQQQGNTYLPAYLAWRTQQYILLLAGRKQKRTFLFCGRSSLLLSLTAIFVRRHVSENALKGRYVAWQAGDA